MAWSRERICLDCGRVDTLRRDNPALRCRSCANRVAGAAGLVTIRARAKPKQKRPRIPGERVERECLTCQRQFTVLACVLKSNASGNFCCRPCYNRWLARTPSLRGRGTGWRDVAHAAIQRAPFSYMKIAMGGKGISGDTIADWSPAFALVPSLNIAYVWHATSHLIDVAIGLQNIGFECRQQIIWHKTVAAMSRSAYHWRHEPCWYAVRKGKTADWCGTRDQSTVWDAASPKHIMSGSKEERFDHPTQKPVILMQRPIENHRGDVYEPFSGSGTTLMAAEITGRRCFAVEIEPRFVDVAIQRWQNFTGNTATRPDGTPYQAARREAVPAD